MRAQVSLEFTFLVMAGTFMIIVFATVFSVLYQDNLSEKRLILANDLAYSLQSELLLAAEVHEGYTREFEVPHLLEGIEYNLTIRNNALIVGEASPLPIPDVNGQIHKGDNIIQKRNGTICLNC